MKRRMYMLLFSLVSVYARAMEIDLTIPLAELPTLGDKSLNKDTSEPKKKFFRRKRWTDHRTHPDILKTKVHIESQNNNSRKNIFIGVGSFAGGLLSGLLIGFYSFVTFLEGIWSRPRK